MSLVIDDALRAAIKAHLESVYPEEGAGFLLGEEHGEERRVQAILPVANAREDGARGNRYLIIPKDMYLADLEAEKRGLEIIGIFHSHPDCPNVPSEFDREWALPWYSYTISRIDNGRAASLRSWRLAEDRSGFLEEKILEP